MTYRGVVFMDRREALKKLAAGAAVGLAAPTVIGTTAFADSGTVTCLPTSFSSAATDIASALVVEKITNGTNNFVRLRIPTAAAGIANVGCPSGYTKYVQYRWSLTGSPGAAGVTPNPNEWSETTGVRVVDSGNSLLTTSGAYTAEVGIRVACRTTTRVCWRCASVAIAFDWTYNPDNTLSTLNSSSVTPGTGATDCDGTPPGTL